MSQLHESFTDAIEASKNIENIMRKQSNEGSRT